MKRIDDKGKLTCRKCNYSWQKRTAEDPVSCPNCHSRKYKELFKEKIKLRRGMDDLILLPDMLQHKCNFNNEYYYFGVACPVCGNCYVHTKFEPENLPDSINLECESGHNFRIKFVDHKGECYCRVKRLEDSNGFTTKIDGVD